MKNYEQVAEVIKKSSYTIVFTGAGISKESGIPAFRGEGGLWGRYDPKNLELEYYLNNTQDSWKVIKEVFYNFFIDVKPNSAHFILAEWENKGIVKSIITQNIDCLHQKAGSKNVIEFHGTNGSFVCINCNKQYNTDKLQITDNPPLCNICNSFLKPNFIFFGEAIPQEAYQKSFIETSKAELIIVIGTTGEVFPAANIPYEAKQNGAKVIEINPQKSNFSDNITDLLIQEKASLALNKINAFI